MAHCFFSTLKQRNVIWNFSCVRFLKEQKGLHRLRTHFPSKLIPNQKGDSGLHNGLRRSYTPYTSVPTQPASSRHSVNKKRPRDPTPFRGGATCTTPHRGQQHHTQKVWLRGLMRSKSIAGDLISRLFRDDRQSGLCTRDTVTQVTLPHFLGKACEPPSKGRGIHLQLSSVDTTRTPSSPIR